MKRFSVLLLLAVLPSLPAAPAADSAPSSPPNQTTFDRLTLANRDLLDLLKKQQAVLEDIQADRKMQNRHIQSLEERLAEALQQNALLQAKIAKLEATAANPPSTSTVASTTNAAPREPSPPPDAPAAVPEPSTYLPPPESEGAPGTMSWHRLFTLSGKENSKSDLFHVQGKQWRVVWHNQDKAGTAYQNTSALFISAFPRDDVVPQKVCAKVGSGGDSAELNGPGNYYLKIEASGGSWELAVEDFR